MDKKLLLSLGAAFITGIAANAADSFECGQWTISIDPETRWAERCKIKPIF